MGLTKGWERDPQRVCVGGGGRGRSEIERREESKRDWLPERVLFIGTQFSILYTSMYSPAEAATSRA
jgi:hypothetical protein